MENKKVSLNPTSIFLVTHNSQAQPFSLLGKKNREIPSNTHSLLKIKCQGLLLSEAGLHWLGETNSSQGLWVT